METRDVIVVGAGIAGLTAAEQCTAAGLDTLVVDKGRGAGGRMATRRFGGGTFDHGAQFFTASSQQFAARAALWRSAGLAAPWFVEDGREHLCGRGGMTAVPKHLAGSLPVLFGRRVERLSWSRRAWTVIMESGERLATRAVLLTPPVPQSVAILRSSEPAVSPDTLAMLDAVRYHPCIALLALLKKPAAVPAPGILRPPGEPVAWIADNQRKGISPLPAITVHAESGWSAKHFGESDDALAQALCRRLVELTGQQPVETQIHRWRFSRPAAGHPASHLVIDHPAPLVLAGDAFGGTNIEAAAVSGHAAAQHLIQQLHGAP